MRKGLLNCYRHLIMGLATLLIIQSCSKASSGDTTNTNTTGTGTTTTAVTSWLTTANEAFLLQKMTTPLNFSSVANTNINLTVDSTQTYQSIDGFGFALTGGSASLINSLSASAKTALLKELFTADSTFIGISYLRISIGASDLSASVFTYDDTPNDTTLSQFNINAGDADLIPVLKQIIALNPTIKIIATPWTAPSWMKSNGSAIGGSLLPSYFQVYANYFVKYIQAMQANGINISAITPQNEPLNPSNNPSMVMQASDELTFIKYYLGPTLQSAGIHTKIIVYDHNCDQPAYPLTVLSDSTVASFADGSAFHLYAGDISALTTVHNAFPNKNVYFTEQWVGAPSNFANDLSWHVQNLIIGATRNWSKNVLEWNLASDPNYNPHTVGGCSTCLGAITIGSGLTRNVSYYVIAHGSKFVQPGAVRIASGLPANLPNVAFLNPDGKKVLIVFNSATIAQSFNIQFNGQYAATGLPAGAVATYIW